MKKYQVIFLMEYLCLRYYDLYTPFNIGRFWLDRVCTNQWRALVISKTIRFNVLWSQYLFYDLFYNIE
jgi:hypothetical protein